MAGEHLSYQALIKAPAQEVYRMLTHSMHLREWFCDVATVDPHPGGRFYAAWNSGFYAAGAFTRAEEPKAVGFTWMGRDEPAQTQVDISLTPAEGGTRVEIVHSGLGSGPEWDKMCAEADEGWKMSLENLASVLETGEDLRFVRRPMMGITFGDFSPEEAARLGVPSTQGVRIGGTVEGMGARKAGLQDGDVIVAMDGKPVVSFESLTSVLQRRQAGQRIPVEFYRGPEKKAVEMELSRRPLPEIPWSAKELAESVRLNYARTDGQLEEFLNSITEEEANFKISPEEWSVKEVLAHLLLGEYFNVSYLEPSVSGYQPSFDSGGGNEHSVTAGLAASFSTAQEMLAELRRLHQATVSIIAALPDSFVQRKSSYWPMAYNYLQPVYHLDEHLAQMQASVAAARK
jgi:uncharacterized protein YndB with AHSA1/START domain